MELEIWQALGIMGAVFGLLALQIKYQGTPLERE